MTKIIRGGSTADNKRVDVYDTRHIFDQDSDEAKTSTYAVYVRDGEKRVLKFETNIAAEMTGFKASHTCFDTVEEANAAKGTK